MRDIGRFTRERWGDAQMRRYLAAFDAVFHSLAERTDLGRACDDIRPGYFRIEQGKHVVFFQRLNGKPIFVVRILHERMLPARHLGDNDDT